MPVNRTLWQARVSKDRWPSGWHCPSCTGGYLALVPVSLHYDEAASSRWVHGEVWFEPDHVVNRFSALLQCTNEQCKEIVAVCGNGGVDVIQDEDGPGYTEVEYFTPVYVCPAVHFIPLAEAIPAG